jgi:FAD:protein FMN transferase
MVALSAGAVCTSTTLRRQWTTEGGAEPEHHLRHPRTGAALRTGLVSVTVVAATAIQAEVLTKAAFVAGRDGAAAVIAAHRVTGVLIADDGTVVELPGLAPFLVAAP